MAVKVPGFEPLGLFLWGFLKDRVYRDALESIIELKDRVREVIGEVDAEMCENVIKNYAKRLGHCLHVAGGQSPDVLFHT